MIYSVGKNLFIVTASIHKMSQRDMCWVEKKYEMIFYVPLGTFGGYRSYNSPFIIINFAFNIAATLIESVILPFKTIW
jgi:hypothetical protein